MELYGFSMTVLHRFLDTTRAYFELVRKQGPMAVPQSERRHISRLQAAHKLPMRLDAQRRENVPA